MLDWIKQNKNFLSIRAIEKHIGMPASTLAKAINGSQSMSKRWIEPLNKFVVELRGVETKEDF